MIEYGLEWHTLDSYFQFKELSAAPGTPEPNQLRLYAKDVGGVSALCYKNDAGTEVCMPTSGSFVTGSGVANQVAIWSGTNTLIGDTGLTFDPSTNILTALGGVVIGDMTLGSVLFAGTSGRVSQDNANLFWDNSNDRLGLAIAVPLARLHVRGTASVHSLRTDRVEAAAGAAQLNLNKARGTVGSEAATQSGDGLGLVGFGGYADGDWRLASAFIQSVAGSLWSSTNRESFITFSNTPAASITQAERFRIGSAGQWGIGGATFGGSGDIFSSGGASAPPTWVTRATLNAALDHGTLAGLGDDDHTQYALLAGRSGGQILIGGTAVADDFTLRATSGIGAGSEAIILQVGNNGALEALRAGQANSQSVIAIGTSVLDLTNANTLEPRLIIAGAGVAHNVEVVRHTTVGGGGAIFTLGATRGAGANTHSALQAGDGIGTLGFDGSDGTRFLAAAMIRAVVTTTFTTDSAIARLDFGANDGSSVSTPPTGMSLSSAGVLSISKTTGQIDLSAISAGSPNLTINATTDTPAITTAGGWTVTGTFPPSTAPAGYMEILVGGNARYIPFWA